LSAVLAALMFFGNLREFKERLAGWQASDIYVFLSWRKRLSDKAARRSIPFYQPIFGEFRHTRISWKISRVAWLERIHAQSEKAKSKKRREGRFLLKR
jgi:hypothetical protein